MRIAVYTAPLPANKANWGDEDWFAFEILTRLAERYDDEEFLWLTPYPLKEPAFQFDSGASFTVNHKPPRSFSLNLNPGKKLISLLSDQKADVLLSLIPTASPHIPCPNCMVVQHTIPAAAPGRTIRRFSVELEAAEAIVTISQAEKDKLSSQYAIPENRITVIQRGIQEGFHAFEWEEREQIKSDYTDGREYLFYPGEIADQQKIINLLKAFSILKKRLRSNMVLVLAGPLSENFKSFPELLGTYYFRKDVKWIKKITLEDRMRLTGAAYAMICPDTPEDFRPEILEAFKCRVPVLAADNALTREIGEEAIVYFDPLNVETSGNVFCELYKDENNRARQIALGDIQAKKFSWENTIALLWKTLNQALHP